MGILIQISIIGDKHIILDHLFDHRMSSLPDLHRPRPVQLRTDIVVVLCYIGKGGKHIQCRDYPCGILDPFHLFKNPVPEIAEHGIFQTVQPFLRSQDHILHLF